MLSPLESLSSHARVWIYQSNRKFTEDEAEYIANQAEKFVSQWAAHGQELKSTFQVLRNQFLVFFVDEDHNSASGCSIDSSVNFVKSLESKFGLNFFDRTLVAVSDQEDVTLFSLSEIKQKVAEGAINEQTMVFNNLVKDKREFEEAWVVPAKDSWLKRYFN